VSGPTALKTLFQGNSQDHFHGTRCQHFPPVSMDSRTPPTGNVDNGGNTFQQRSIHGEMYQVQNRGILPDTRRISGKRPIGVNDQLRFSGRRKPGRMSTYGIPSGSRNNGEASSGGAPSTSTLQLQNHLQGRRNGTMGTYLPTI